uniref:Uncharacterized protein n=1 Tax=Timspurckia oligopyrenoides TaxID=708627 RepID=A0A7S0ZD95_9RHOD|mmetsp:Transcript_13299/g.23887  ORF Transcript_13299/g.23887 Transcript_13299/m.23887 type:complete len:318 (+) Transcript_13299:111-1064(+)|eukprot:CAMPEP_0182450082 /NCGR_PEP_ID=MMETSP1172-20130603/38776_1 /TAXON_ID=708627 /ORGANISM="Timspurckia oligopyrenoides, Strain CCMP3278" /LENGTH=317 /DNA_ID=CAMNT_0024647573 /DNA_START=36 /DNA_END=989 /DNA_ORIENTATION=+
MESSFFSTSNSIGPTLTEEPRNESFSSKIPKPKIRFHFPEDSLTSSNATDITFERNSQSQSSNLDSNDSHHSNSLGSLNDSTGYSASLSSNSSGNSLKNGLKKLTRSLSLKSKENPLTRKAFKSATAAHSAPDCSATDSIGAERNENSEGGLNGNGDEEKYEKVAEELNKEEQRNEDRVSIKTETKVENEKEKEIEDELEGGSLKRNAVRSSLIQDLPEFNEDEDSASEEEERSKDIAERKSEETEEEGEEEFGRSSSIFKPLLEGELGGEGETEDCNESGNGMLKCGILLQRCEHQETDLLSDEDSEKYQDVSDQE